jgi:hypothetical protein
LSIGAEDDAVVLAGSMCRLVLWIFPVIVILPLVYEDIGTLIDATAWK